MVLVHPPHLHPEMQSGINKNKLYFNFYLQFYVTFIRTLTDIEDIFTHVIVHIWVFI